MWGLKIRQVSWVEKYTLNNCLDSIYQLEKMSGVISVNVCYEWESMMNSPDHNVSWRENPSISYSVKKGLLHLHGHMEKILIQTLYDAYCFQFGSVLKPRDKDVCKLLSFQHNKLLF